MGSGGAGRGSGCGSNGSRSSTSRCRSRGRCTSLDHGIRANALEEHDGGLGVSRRAGDLDARSGSIDKGLCADTRNIGDSLATSSSKRNGSACVDTGGDELGRDGSSDEGKDGEGGETHYEYMKGI